MGLVAGEAPQSRALGSWTAGSLVRQVLGAGGRPSTRSHLCATATAWARVSELCLQPGVPLSCSPHLQTPAEPCSGSPGPSTH